MKEKLPKENIAESNASLPGEEAQVLAVLRPHWKKIFFVSAAVILLVWGVAVIGDSILGRSSRAVTAQAVYDSKQVTISAEVTFVRDEIRLPASGEGVVVMLADAGERVAAQQSLAMVCDSRTHAEALAKQQDLERRLGWLQEASETQHYHALNAEQLGRQVDETFSEFLKALDRGSFGSIAEQQEFFLHRATTLEAALGEDLDFTAEIAAVQAQLQGLGGQAATGLVTPVASPVSGDYYPIADGLEDRLTVAMLEQITVEELTALQQLEARPEDLLSMGKVVADFRWYAVTVIELGQAQQLREGAQYDVLFPQESAREFPMTVEAIHPGKDNKAVVVLSCNEKDDTIHCMRSAKAEIVTETHEGLVIPSAAVRFLEKDAGTPLQRSYKGVYIKRAGKTLLREVEVLYQDGETAVIAWGNLNEAKAVAGDRFVIQGKILSVTSPADNKLLIIGQGMSITAENLDVVPAIPGGPTTVVASKRSLFDETILTGKNLVWQQEGDTLVITGDNVSYREQRGTGLKIHDSVITEGG